MVDLAHRVLNEVFTFQFLQTIKFTREALLLKHGNRIACLEQLKTFRSSLGVTFWILTLLVVYNHVTN